MRIEVDKIAKSGNAFVHTYVPDELLLNDESLRLTKPPEIRAQVKRRGERIELQGHISARAGADCDRCLKAFELPVETDFEAIYVPAALNAEAEAEAELQDDDLNVSAFDGETIDIDELVREQILLALPLRALCAENCKGLCPTCGANRNADAACDCEQTEIDPRWAALKNLRLNKD